MPLLELALADREPGIRLDAARALAQQPAYASKEAALLGAYAAAPTARERASLLGLLADARSNAKGPWLGRALRSVEALEQEAACLAVQRLASRGHAPLAADVSRVLELIERGESSVRGACASALGEPVARETARAAGISERAASALADLARSPELESAQLAAHALAAEGGPQAARALTELAGSSSPRIALEAVRGLRHTVSPAALEAAVERELRQLRSDRRSRRTGVLLELLHGLEQHPDAPEAAAAADRVLGATSEPATGVNQAVQLERALLHCAAAQLADAARHWPKELFTCGHGRVPEGLRDAWIAHAFARADGSDDLRALQLTRLFEKGPVPVQLAVLRASASLPVEQATALLRAGLRHNEPRVIGAAAREIAARPGLRQAPSVERLGARDLVEAAPRAAQRVDASVDWLLAARALGRSAPVHSAAGAEPPAPIKSASGSSERTPVQPRTPVEPDASEQAVEGTRARAPAELIEHVTQLARHPALAVRAPAAALLSEWQAPQPLDIEPVESPLAADRMPGHGAVFHVKLQTTAGTIELDLNADGAPVAAVRFVELVRSGALDGVPVEQLSLGRAVSFLPREGASLRHERTADMVGRGSVLLQDHGRDAVGPGFALILARAPSLDRRAVAIGTITAGLEVADTLLPVDAILEAQVEAATR